MKRLKRMKRRDNNGAAVIGGADGPTAIFLAGGDGKKSLQSRVKTFFYRRSRKHAAKKITAGTHTLLEVAAYAVRKYKAVDMDTQNASYIEQKNNLKESLITEHKPELLGTLQEIARPDFSDQESVKEFLKQMEKRRTFIADIPDGELGMDYHIFQISMQGGSLELEVDYRWDYFGISWSGDDKAMKKLKKISRDLYLYYGVSEKDIKEKTRRYKSLVTALSS